jgi:hypothetical protein
VRTLSAPDQYHPTRSGTSGTKVQYRLERIVNILAKTCVGAFPVRLDGNIHVRRCKRCFCRISMATVARFSIELFTR